MVVKTITGGAKLKRALADIEKKVSKRAGLRVGFLEGSTYDDGTSLPMVAAIQEYGAPAAGVPPRPYFRPMVAAKKGEWGPALGRVLVAANYDSEVALDLMGQGIVGQLQESITHVTEPKLSPVTLMLRAMFPVTSVQRKTYADIAEARRLVARGESPGDVSDKPLVWTKTLLKGAGHEVTDTLP